MSGVCGRVMIGTALTALIAAQSLAIAVLTALTIAWTSPVRVEIPWIVAAWTDRAGNGTLQVELSPLGILFVIAAVVLVGFLTISLDVLRSGSRSGAAGS